MTDQDDKLSRRYRELAREEPSAAMDAAILAASRRALAKPSITRRWAVPASIAAVLVLAFGVTLEMQREQPGIESSEPAARSIAPSAPARAPEPAASSPAGKMREEKPPAVLGKIQERKLSAPPERKITPSKPAQGAAATQSLATQESAVGRAEPQPFAVAPTSPAAAPPADAMAPATSAVPPPAAPARVAPAGAENRAASAPPAAADQTPRAKRESTTSTSTRMLQSAPLSAADADRELERIARLRAEGRHAEADKALEEFRRKHPDFRISEAMWERVKPR